MLTKLDINLNIDGTPITFGYVRNGNEFTGNADFMLGKMQFAGTIEK